MTSVALWVVVGIIVIGVIAVIMWRFRPQEDPNSLESLGLLPKTVKADPGEIEKLRQSLRLKVLHDEAKVDRLIEAERERAPGGSSVEWYRAAITRWERDNR